MKHIFLILTFLVVGLHGLRALDAYNGHVLWEYPLKNILKAYDQEHLMGAAGTGSHFGMWKQNTRLVLS